MKLNRLKKVLYFLFKRYNSANKFTILEWNRFLDCCSLYNYSIERCFFIYFFFKRKDNIDFNILKDFRKLIAVLYISYLKQNNIYNNFIANLKTSNMHNYHDLESYCDYFVNQKTNFSFMTKTFEWGYTNEGFDFWCQHTTRAIQFVLNFFKKDDEYGIM